MPYVYFSKVKKLLLVLLMKRISLKPLKTCPRSRWAGHILHMKPCFSMMVVRFPRGCGFRSVRGNWSTPVWWSKILGPSHDDSNLCYHHVVGILGLNSWIMKCLKTTSTWLKGVHDFWMSCQIDFNESTMFHLTPPGCLIKTDSI